MTRMRAFRCAAIAASSASALVLGGCSTTSMQEVAAVNVEVGRNATDDPCALNRSYRDPTVSGYFNASFVITCRNVSASRPQGLVRLVRDDQAVRDAVEATLQCGAGQPLALAGVGEVQIRRCTDSVLGAETLVLTAERGSKTVIASGTTATARPLAHALRWAVTGKTGLDTGEAGTDLAIDVASLAPPPGAATADLAGSAFDPDVALRQGIWLNRRGLYTEASRLLNDALSRLPADATPALRAELSLEAGLADSNISFSQAAQEHFQRANVLIDSAGGERRATLQRKRDIYTAFDLINRRAYRDALDALGRITSPTNSDQPLQNLAVVRTLNQTADRSDLAGSVSVPNLAVLDQLVLDAQSHLARSGALYALGDFDGATTALAAADASYAPLSGERIQQGPVLWLRARLDRQRARLLAARKDWSGALAAYDRAVDAVTLGALESGGTGREPAVAELRLERAAIVAQQNAPRDVVRTAYRDAIEETIAAGTGQGVVPRGLQTYLDLLVEDARSGAGADTNDLFFRAVQSFGEPAVARQLSRIEQVVTADPQVATKVRERESLMRELTRLRYEISETGTRDAAAVTALERQRSTAEERLDRLDAELGSDARFGSVADAPATVEEIRTALRPGEVFLKLSEVGPNLYGILIGQDGATIYRSEAPAADLAKIATQLRASIDGQVKSAEKLVAYNVALGALLFDQIAGPARNRLLGASAIVIDPAGPLERIPAGVLVTDKASIAWYDRRKAQDPWDYSGVSFLVSKAAMSTALSPRSFLVSRALPASRAPKPFIGFAEHVAPTRGVQFASAGQVDVGNVCSVEAEALRELAMRMSPIDRQEVVIAADALGAQASPVVAGQQFNDTAVRARGDLAEFAVLHFATHGLEEGQWGCSKSPPALVTSFGDRNSDGLLSFDEIARLQLDANLVVLSACDTGAGIRSEALARRSGQEEAGSTLAGLVRAFLTANTRAVMATHWQVPAKEGTYDFVRSFYGTARSTDIGAALQTAQRALIANPEHSHPFYWGAYFVVGDSSKSMLSPRQTASR